MTRPVHIAILPALAAALFFSLACLAAQRGEISELKRSTQSEYRAEVAYMLVSDPEYLHRLQEQTKPVATVTVTAYNADPSQTDSDPDIAASMRRVKPGTIAVSRDLFDRGWVFGRKVRLEGLGIFEINDLMAARHNRAIDIFLYSNSKALAFGKRRIKAALLYI
ncbi:MAG: 3D domain-containing protein [Proteobacteria bacterium]|nr:3D domain-containing protein [Pseudomonadota bacterium]MBU1594900.1 3D domain-containing protein [Pseudomonadota bacterium]